MFDWLRKAAGAVGNAFNQGASFVAHNNPVSQTFNYASQAAAEAQRRLREQQLAQQRAQQQAQQMARVNAQRLQQAVPKINLNAALGAINKFSSAANPVNQFKSQINTLNAGAQKANQFGEQLNRLGVNYAGKSLGFNPQQVQDLQRLNPNDRAKAILNQQINSVRKNPMMGIINSPLNPIASLNKSYSTAPVNLPKPDLTKMVSNASNTIASSRIGKNPVVGFIGDAIVRPVVNSPARWIDASTGQEQYSNGIKGLAEGGSDAFNIASLLYTPAKAGVTAAAVKQGGLRAGLKFVPGAVARGFGSGVGINVLNQAANKDIKNIDPKEALMAGGITGVANAALPFAPGLVRSILGKGNHIDLNAPQIAKNLADKGRLRAQGFTNVKVGKIVSDTPIQPSKAVNENFVHNADGKFGNKLNETPQVNALKQYQADQVKVMQSVPPSSPTYQGAVKNYQAAQQRLDSLAKQTKVIAQNAPSYRSSHQITDAVPIHQANIDKLTNQVKSKYGLTNFDHADIKKLKAISSNPEGDVKIYRASPVGELNSGDWVTTSKTYAHDIKRQNGGTVHEYTVKAKELNLPKNIEDNPSLARFSAFKYLKDSKPIAETAPQPGLPKGYKMTAAGDVVDSKGRQLTTGEIQQLMQPKALTQAEKLVNSGQETVAQTQKLENQLAGNPIYETVPSGALPPKVVKDRGTIETIKGSSNTSKGLKAALTSQPYTELPNAKTMSQAVETINVNPQAALNEVLSNKPRTAQLNAQALILAEKAQQRGDFDMAQKIFTSMAPGNTQQGQAIQILSVWSKTKPEGVVKYAQKVVDDANNVLITEGKNPSITLSAEQAGKFRKMAQAIEKMPEGKDKLIATQKMLNEIHQTIPATIGEKLSTVMYYAQLLNPKTAIRNVIGNLGFGATEMAKDVVGAPIDMAVTGVRKLLGQDAKRTVYMPNVLKQLKWGYQGGKEAFKEARAGVNLSGLEGQLQIGNKQPAFRGKGGEFFSKAMQTELSVPDRAFYTARYEQALHNMMKAEKVSKPTKEMMERADYAGKYVTFQDDSRAAQAFVAFKNGLNKIAGTKDGTFGAGNFVINYPKTPGNIIARGLDYSPVGFIKSTMEMARPLFRKGPFDQQKFVESFSRAAVGSGALLGTGALLHRAGIITGKPSKDKDVNAQDKATGLGAYRINVSALKRFVTSGFNPESGKLRDGDQLVSYDWFQPAAIGISMGANIDETKASNKGAVGKMMGILGAGGSSVAGGLETIANQPLVQGLTKLTGNGGGLVQGALATATGIPASFIPTAVSQLNQLMDNTARSTYDPNVAVQGVNMLKAKIPGLAQTLQPQVGPDGTPNERYQNGSNNIFNVMFNPAFTGKYQADDVQKEISRLEDVTGQTSQYPSIIKNTQTVNGQDVQLSPQQVTAMQKLQGQLTQEAYKIVMSNPEYAKLSDTDKVKKLQNIITAANQRARQQVLGDSNDGGDIQKALDLTPKQEKIAKVKSSSKKSSGRKTGRSSGRRTGRRGSIPRSKAPRIKSVRISRGTAPKISKTPKLKLRSYT